MSESTRPRKRARTKNVFIDLEAVADDEYGEEEEEEEAVQDEFMAEDEYDATDGPHLALYQSITQADEEGGLDGHLQGLEERSHWRSQHSHPHILQAMEDGRYQLQETDMLWEIGCKEGTEDDIPFKVMQRACHPSTPEVLAKSIIATPIPGRIYAEVNGFKQAMKLAHTLEELSPSRISLVPREDIFKILNIASRHACQQWVRVGGKKKPWHWYQGDTGLIEKFEGMGKFFLALIPRLALEDICEGQSRPRQAVVERAVLEARFGAALIENDEYGGFIWEEQRFSVEGLLLVDLDDIDILPIWQTLPSSAEFAVFRSTPLLSSETAAQTDRIIRQTRMKVGDRVKVIAGVYLGLIGEVVEMKENEVAVYLPSQDITEDVMLDTVRGAFVVGDQVKVVDGPKKGLIAWVIDICADMLRLLNVEDEIEVNIQKMDVEFYTPAYINTIRRRDEYPKWMNLGGKNPNDIYVGKRVVVTGKHIFKGYKGAIKTTTPQGFAHVQLDSRAQQTIEVELVDLAILTKEDVPSAYLLSNQSLPATLSILPQAASSSSSTSLELTPAWDSSSHTSSSLSPAWDPSSQTPLPQDCHSRPVHWLDDPALQTCRLKLETNDPKVGSSFVEFMGIENNLVKVRDKRDYKFISFESVKPLLPNSKGDLVILKEGDMRGIHFKVIEIAEGLCVIRKPGTRPTKNNQDHKCLISELIQVYPAFR